MTPTDFHLLPSRELTRSLLPNHTPRLGESADEVKMRELVAANRANADAGASGNASARYYGWEVTRSLLPRLLTTPSGSQWLPTTPDSSLRLQTHAVVV